jgi:hypothetical protein
MKFSFKKIGSVLASTAMLSSTIALAAAANFPAPFVSSNGADVAIVHGGTKADYRDLVAVTDISTHLSSELAKLTATGGSSSGGTTSGETSGLFSSGTKLYINDSINAVKSVVTETELANTLVDGSFSGNVDATFTQTVEIGSNPRVTFAKQPTSSDDPDYSLALSTTTSNYIYNASVSFNKAVQFNHTDSEGEQIELFGQSFTVGSATDATNLILLKSAEKMSLSNDDPSREVTIGGSTYTVELRSASTTTATVKVTNSAGVSAEKEISEAASKKVNGLTIAVDTADANNFALTATLTAGAEKVTLTDGSAVTIGEDDTVIDGTKVTITGGIGAMTKLVVSVVAEDSDSDALKPGESFTDPVFGSFKLDFAGLNIADDSTAREEISFANSGDDKIEIKFTDSRGNEKNFQFAKNYTAAMKLEHDDDGRNITVREREAVYRSGFLVVGNEDEGRLLKVTQITNQTTSYTSDKVKLQDVFSGDTYEATLTAEGVGTVTIGGKVYNLNYFGAQSASEDTRFVRLNYPDSSAAGDMVLFPTIETSKGAKIALYEPILNISLKNWDGASNELGKIRIPDGDGYTDITITNNSAVNSNSWNVTFGSTITTLNTTNHTGGQVKSAAGSVGQLQYNVTVSAVNEIQVRLLDPFTDLANINNPAVIVLEEKDDNTEYHGAVVTVEPGSTSDDGIGVDDVIRTWSDDGTWDAINLASDSKVSKEGDLWGMIATVDSSDSDQKSATLSYPDEQLTVELYLGETSSTATSGTVGGGGVGSVTALGSVSVPDTQASSVAGKNLIVVGGSCVNSVAAELLGVSSPTCGAAFTAATGVGSNQYLIESFARTGDKVATLVAGYEAKDTTNAAKALITNSALDTKSGMKYTGSTSTDVTAAIA